MIYIFISVISYSISYLPFHHRTNCFQGIFPVIYQHPLVVFPLSLSSPSPLSLTLSLFFLSFSSSRCRWLRFLWLNLSAYFSGLLCVLCRIFRSPHAKLIEARTEHGAIPGQLLTRLAAKLVQVQLGQRSVSLPVYVCVSVMDYEAKSAILLFAPARQFSSALHVL